MAFLRGRFLTMFNSEKAFFPCGKLCLDIAQIDREISMCAHVSARDWLGQHHHRNSKMRHCRGRTVHSFHSSLL
jgi:hypothetical protein